jgi:cytosine/adenosine deaminase-related metal-dependent hydrolase
MARVTVLRGGRVVDPASGRDEVTDVVISDDRVASVGPTAEREITEADEVVDVGGLIVGPGFIDLHSHAQSVTGHRMQALDGVTTSLELEAGVNPVAVAYTSAASEGRPLNYGFSASWAMARMEILGGFEADGRLLTALAHIGDPAWQRQASTLEVERILARLRSELADGGLGVGILVGYAPRISPDEYLAVAHLAAEARAPTYTHAREIVEADPTTPVDGSEEIVRAAAEMGAHMHHCHVNSTSRRHIDRVLTLLEHARAEGARISVEAYPYGSGSTGIGAFFLEPDRLSAWGITPQAITYLPTGERVADADRLRHLRATDPGGLAIIDFLDEADPTDAGLLRRSLLHADSIVASDAMPLMLPRGTDPFAWPPPPGIATHPRTAGTFAKALRIMVRESSAWSWVEAFRRCSLLPAGVVAEVAPSMRNKRRLAPGADADVVVLDPSVVSEAATYADPVRPSRGVRHLLVAGRPVVHDGVLVADTFPGQPIRGVPA